MNAKNCLENRRILITGATGMLGSRTALAAAAAGAHLVLLARSESGLNALADRIEDAGGAEPVLLAMDFNSATAVEYQNLASALSAEGLDGLVLAAASLSGLHPLDHLPPTDWERTMKVNVGAAFNLTGALLPLLVRSGQGRVIAVTDPAARSAKAFWGAYAASKTALDTLIGVLAAETENRVRCTRFAAPPMPSALRAAAWVGGPTPPADNADQAARALVALLAADDLPGLDTSVESVPG